MSRKQHIGSHSQHAHPDGQMNVRNSQASPTQRQVDKKVAAKKRRQRDKRVTD